MRSPFEITVYDKNLKRVGFLNDWISLNATLKHCDVGTASITVAADDNRLPILSMPGARVAIRFRSPFDKDQTTREHLMSGYIVPSSGQGPTPTGTQTITVEDDLGLLTRMLSWPIPNADLNSQGTKADTRTGPAETVVKAYVAAQLAHNAVDPITVAADLGRGTSINPSVPRMTLLGDTLFPLVDKAGIGLTARQVNDSTGNGTSIQLDAYTPSTYPHVLSEEAGTINNYTYSRTDGITRVIVQKPTDDSAATSRQYLQIKDPREASYGYTREMLVDASSAASSSGVTLTQAIYQMGLDALAENGPKVGFTVELAENQTFHYGGNGVHLGDLVPFEILGNSHTEVLRSVEFSMDYDNGLVVSPTFGEHSDDPDTTIIKYVAALGQSVARLTAA